MDNETRTQNGTAPKQTQARVEDMTAAERRAAARAAKKEKKRRKKESRRLRREYEAKKKQIPQHKKPIICPPELSDVSKKTVIIGYIIRAFVIFTAVLALSFFVSEALGFDMSYDDAQAIIKDTGKEYTGVAASASISFLAMWSAVFVAIFAASSLIKRGYLIGFSASAVILLLLALPNPVQMYYEGALTFYNGALGHMQHLGFYGYFKYMVDFSAKIASPESLVRLMMVVFVFITAAIFTPSIIRRVRIAAPAIFASILLAGAFMLNLSKSSWAIALIIASFGAIIVMQVFDKTYIAQAKSDIYDDAGNIFGETQEPPIPERILQKLRAKEERRKERERRRLEKKAKRKKKAPVTVEEELTDYFAEPKHRREKVVKTKLTPEQKKAARAEREAEKKRRRAERDEDRAAMKRLNGHRSKVLTRNAAMGGFAGVGAFALAMIMLFIPALTVSGSFNTIDAIDNKMDYYRDYLTALIMGDDPALDTLAYEGDERNFAPRDTLAVPRYFTGAPLMTVESNLNYGTYMKGWIGTSYKDGAWHTAEPYSDTMERYRYLFGIDTDPSETIYYNFFNVLAPEDMPNTEYDFTSKIKRLDKYGFGLSQVNIRRDPDFSSRTLYMPSQSILRSLNSGSKYLWQFGGSSDGNISYANFFDGTYTSYRAGLLTDEGYATVAMLQNMKMSSFYYNITELIVELNYERSAIEKGVSRDEDGAVTTYTLKYSDGKKLDYFVRTDSTSGATVITVPQENGDAVYTCLDGQVKKELVNFEPVYDEYGEPQVLFAPKLPLAIRYFEVMSDAERSEYNKLINYLDYYTPFVYDTYMEKSGSTIISELSKKLIAEATVDEYMLDENGISHMVPVPADFSKAIGKSTYREANDGSYKLLTAVTDIEVYRQRHALVMEIIDYLTDEDNFTYTLKPTARTDEDLDGVENFLTVTKEGYCVQFASAAALLLREAGIPVRYVEGYLATDFVSNPGTDIAGRYVTTVRDWNAHAWIEVWFDGIGWIQYETTPAFYNDFYDTSSSSSGTVDRPWDDEEKEPVEEEDPYEGLTDYEIEQLIKEQQEAARRELIKKIIIYSIVTLVVVGLIATFFIIVLRRARRLAGEREALLERLTHAKDKGATAPERADVRRMSELISRLLEECGLSPRTGEFREEYATRIARECAGALSRPAPSEKLKGFEAETSIVREKDVLEMFDAIAAEEFGHGAPVAAMPTMAKFYRRIYATVYRRKAFVLRRVYLFLFKGEM